MSPSTPAPQVLTAIRNRLRRGDRLVRSEVKFLESDALPAEEQAALAALCMEYQPDQPLRRELQAIAFAHLGAGLHCFRVRDPSSQDVWGVSPRIVLRREVLNDRDLRRQVLGAVRAYRPPQHPRSVIGENLDTAIVPYRDVGEHLWSKAKHWRGYSGSDIHLAMLWTPALDVAATLSALDPAPDVLVAVPAHPPMDASPGQISDRFAHLVSRLVELPVLPALTRGPVNDLMLEPDAHEIRGRRVALIDDHIRTGQTMATARTALEANGAEVVASIAWSASSGIKSPDRACVVERISKRMELELLCPRHGS